MTPDNPEVTMVERCAKAMWQRAHDGQWPQDAEFPDIYRGDARAAIEAMREPTAEMYEAISNSGKMWRETNSSEVYRTMIDAALSEGVKGGGE